MYTRKMFFKISLLMVVLLICFYLISLPWGEYVTVKNEIMIYHNKDFRSFLRFWSFMDRNLAFKLHDIYVCMSLKYKVMLILCIFK